MSFRFRKLFNFRVVENDRCSNLIVQLLNFAIRLIHLLKSAIHCFTGVVFKRDIQLPSGSFESVSNWLNGVVKSEIVQVQ